MKILFIAPLPPPVTGHSLASKVFLDELIKFHQCDVINLSKDGFRQGINSISRIIKVLSVFKEVWKKKTDADVIYLTISESFAGNFKDLLIYLLCFNKLSRMVIHVHGGSIKKNLFDKINLIFRVNKFFFDRLGAIIVLGKTHFDTFSKFIETKKIHVVSNFAEDYIFIREKEIKEKFENTASLNILFLSNLIQGKGHNDLLDAYLSLASTLKQSVKIDFAGGFESDFHKIEFLNKIDGFKGIHYHGIVDGAEKRNLLARSHLFCLPTCLNEGQPISILEAYASGCVVITTGEGGIHDIFRDKINGFEVQKNSANSIKEVIEQIIKNTECLLPMSISNRKIANDRYRTTIFNNSLIRIVENIGSGQLK